MAQHPSARLRPSRRSVRDVAPWTANAVLGDGETVSIRPITPADAPRLAEFHRRQSDESRYRRYFTPKPTLSQRELEHFTNVDLVDRAALLVESHGELLGWASYERWPGRDDADTSFMVDDAHQGTGIATLLLEHLAAIAVSNGIERFTAEVLGENRPMLAVFARAGWPLHRRFESGVIEVDFPIAATPEFVDSMSRREQRADSRAIARMLLPRAIAVVGATDRPGIGRRGAVAQRDRRRHGAGLRRQSDAHAPRRRTRVRQRHRHSCHRLAGGHRRPRRVSRADDRRLHRRPRPRRGRADVGGQCRTRHRCDRRQGAQQRNAHHRAVEHGRGGGPTADRPQRLAGARAADRRQRGDLDAVRLARGVVPGARQAAGARTVVVRVVRRPCRRLGHRPAAVLRGRRIDAGDRPVHRGPRRHTPLRPHRSARVAAPPDRRRAHRRRARSDEQRPVPALWPHRGADRRRVARHRQGPRHPAGAARRPHRRAVQLSQPAAPGRPGARRPRVAHRRSTGPARLPGDSRRLCRGDRRGASFRRRRRPDGRLRAAHARGGRRTRRRDRRRSRSGP